MGSDGQMLGIKQEEVDMEAMGWQRVIFRIAEVTCPEHHGASGLCPSEQRTWAKESTWSPGNW